MTSQPEVRKLVKKNLFIEILILEKAMMVVVSARMFPPTTDGIRIHQTVLESLVPSFASSGNLFDLFLQ